MESNIIEKIIQYLMPLKMPTEYLMGMILFMCSFLIFIPSVILQKIGLQNVLIEYKSIIPLIFLFSFAYFIIKIIHKIYMKICQFIELKKYIKRLNSLPKSEKDIVEKMYKKGNSDCLCPSNPHVGSLCNKNIIYRSVNLGYPESYGYTLQHWVVEFIDKHNEYIFQCKSINNS